MSQAGELMRRGQAAHAAQFPAGTVTINGQAYADFSTSGVKRERDLVTGGHLPDYKVTFWGLAQAFITAGQPFPQARQHLTWGGLTLGIDVVALDATEQTISLVCMGKDK